MRIHRSLHTGLSNWTLFWLWAEDKAFVIFAIIVLACLCPIIALCVAIQPAMTASTMRTIKDFERAVVARHDDIRGEMDMWRRLRDEYAA